MRDKPVQWMTIQELRDERERTRAVWEAQRADLTAFLGSGELPDIPPAARRHQEVSDELARRASGGRAPRTSTGPQESPLEPDARDTSS